jgi:hypothetical protein
MDIIYQMELDEMAEEIYNSREIIKEQDIELDKYKAKEKELREYITSYESIGTIQGLDNIIKNKDLDDKTMIEMTNRYLEVHDKLLDILDSKE